MISLTLDDDESDVLKSPTKLHYVFNFTGSVWIFSLHNMMATNPSSPFFCDPTIVMFGLYVTSISWVLLGIVGIYLSLKFFC